MRKKKPLAPFLEIWKEDPSDLIFGFGCHVQYVCGYVEYKALVLTGTFLKRGYSLYIRLKRIKLNHKEDIYE